MCSSLSAHSTCSSLSTWWRWPWSVMLMILSAIVLPLARWRASRTVPHAPEPSVCSGSSCSSVSDDTSPFRIGDSMIPVALILKPPFENVPVSLSTNDDAGAKFGASDRPIGRPFLGGMVAVLCCDGEASEATHGGGSGGRGPAATQFSGRAAKASGRSRGASRACALSSSWPKRSAARKTPSAARKTPWASPRSSSGSRSSTRRSWSTASRSGRRGRTTARASTSTPRRRTRTASSSTTSSST